MNKTAIEVIRQILNRAVDDLDHASVEFKRGQQALDHMRKVVVKNQDRVDALKAAIETLEANS